MGRGARNGLILYRDVASALTMDRALGTENRRETRQIGISGEATRRSSFTPFPTSCPRIEKMNAYSQYEVNVQRRADIRRSRKHRARGGREIKDEEEGR